MSWKGKRKAEHKAQEWARKYHSVERVMFVRQLACSVPRCLRYPSVNAHGQVGGMGWKAGYLTILPLCHAHHKELDEGHGREAFEEKYGVNLQILAERTEELWLQAGDFPNLEF